MKKYFGITHGVPMWMLPLWKKWFCRKNMHCFDEVLSEHHYLHCDACGLMVHIEKIETTYQEF